MGEPAFPDILRHDGTSSVLFLTNDFPPSVGGIQTFVRHLCDELPGDQVAGADEVGDEEVRRMAVELDR